MNKILEKKGFICDMDGVIYHGNKILDGVLEFVNWMLENDKKFVFLTNSPERTPHELSMKLERMGLSVSADHFYTSAMATAEFLHSQAPFLDGRERKPKFVRLNVSSQPTITTP